MNLNILTEDEIEKIEKKLSEKYRAPLEVSLKKDRGMWYNIERLILEIKYLSPLEIERMDKNPKYIDQIKQLRETVSKVIELIKIRRKIKKSKVKAGK